MVAVQVSVRVSTVCPAHTQRVASFRRGTHLIASGLITSIACIVTRTTTPIAALSFVFLLRLSRLTASRTHTSRGYGLAISLRAKLKTGSALAKGNYQTLPIASVKISEENAKCLYVFKNKNIVKFVCVPPVTGG